jgi:hypothetical protein
MDPGTWRALFGVGFLRFAGGSMFGGSAVYAGFVIAPSHKKATVFTVAGLLLGYAGIGGFAAAILHNWLELLEVLSMASTAGMLAYGLVTAEPDEN